MTTEFHLRDKDGIEPAASGSEPSAESVQRQESAASDTSPASKQPDVDPEGTSPAAPEQEELSFAEMLAEHERDEQSRPRLTPGQRVTVRIVAITNDTIFVSTGSKVDGIVDREEMEVDGELPYQVGDAVELYVVTVSPQEVKLSKIIRGAGSLSVLEEAKDAGLPVEGKVTAQVKGGYAVEIMKRRAFCPMSQIDIRPLDIPESPLGKTFAFLITRLEKGGRNIVVSRRSLLEREVAETMDALLADMHEGDVVEAVITRLVPFGAFAELAPGVEGLVHLSELAWTRGARADETVSIGERVRTKVLSIDKGEKGVKISLSVKQVTEDPWKAVPARLTPGDVVSGRVMRTVPFGAFVEVLPGVEGLVHLSELSFERRVNKVEDVVVAGDTVTVKVKEVDPDKKRLSLSIRDVGGDPWDRVADTLAMGDAVTGTVEKRAPFGLFVTLAPGITGLLPASVLQASFSRKDLELLVPGDAVAVRVGEIDAKNRRISLTPGDEGTDSKGGEQNWKPRAALKPQAPSVGALGLALRAALEKKKK